MIHETPPKTNMEHKSEGLEDDFPFQRGDFQSSMLVFCEVEDISSNAEGVTDVWITNSRNGWRNNNLNHQDNELNWPRSWHQLLFLDPGCCQTNLEPKVLEVDRKSKQQNRVKWPFDFAWLVNVCSVYWVASMTQEPPIICRVWNWWDCLLGNLAPLKNTIHLFKIHLAGRPRVCIFVYLIIP